MKRHNISKISELNNLCKNENKLIWDNDMCIIIKHDSLGIGTGTQPDTYQRDKIAEIGIVDDVFYGEYFGGTIVCFPNDLSIVWRTSQNSDIALHSLEQVCKFLNSKNLIVRRSGNDLLLYDDGNTHYKVASCGKGVRDNEENHCVENYIHISIGMDLDIIKQICTKPMVKTPKGLQDYNINADEIMRHLTSKRLIPSTI